MEHITGILMSYRHPIRAPVFISLLIEASVPKDVSVWSRHTFHMSNGMQRTAFHTDIHMSSCKSQGDHLVQIEEKLAGWRKTHRVST